jgi:uncharacterized membrane protein YadS
MARPEQSRNSAGPVPELDYRRSGVCRQTAAGMAMFNPMMLPMAIGIAFYNIVGTAGWAKQSVTFSLRRLLGIVILPFGSQLTSSRLVPYADDKDVSYAIACVFGSVAMLADRIATDAEAWIVAATTSLLIALAAMGLETNIGKLTARGFRPAWLGTLALPFIAGFSLTLIKLME